MFRQDSQQLKLSADMDSDFTSGEWDVRGVASGFIEVAWSGMINAGLAASVYLEATGTKVCWCRLNDSATGIDPGESCSGLELREGHGFSWLRVVFDHGGTTAGTMSIVATGKVLMDNGVSGGNL